MSEQGQERCPTCDGHPSRAVENWTDCPDPFHTPAPSEVEGEDRLQILLDAALSHVTEAWPHADELRSLIDTLRAENVRLREVARLQVGGSYAIADQLTEARAEAERLRAHVEVATNAAHDMERERDEARKDGVIDAALRGGVLLAEARAEVTRLRTGIEGLRDRANQLGPGRTLVTGEELDSLLNDEEGEK
jgi:hypothetical protein